jgi:hypothetical protein
MSFLSRLFGSGSEARRPKDVEAELGRLEAEAENARPGYVGTAFNKAGDLALRSNQPDRAVGYYGRAIDAFLEDLQREAARGVANKIIRVRPSAVRTLCTLTWLDLAAQHQATALLHLRDYVESAKQADQHTRAAAQIYAMAKLSSDPEFVDAVADALDGLAFTRRARTVRSWAADGSPDAIADPEELALACLSGAVNSSVSDTGMVGDEEGVDDEVHDEIPQAEAPDSRARAEGRESNDDTVEKAAAKRGGKKGR